jgi:hypothetical protein
MAAAAAGALISGVAMYAVGARAAQDPFAQNPAYVQTLDGQYVPVARSGQVVPMGQPVSYATSLQPAAPVVTRTVAPRQTVYRSVEPVQERVVSRETQPRRSKTKTALIIGGSAASGAGVGGLVGGKKGALIGAALGGGAASIYEATRR